MGRKKKQLSSTDSDESKSSKSKIPSTNILLVIAAVVVIGAIGSQHLSQLFENDRYFSALSPLERELSFRTEMGLYYSYYKTVVESPTLMDGIHSLLYDNITEFPLTINTLKRFNLYPEVIVGAMYRLVTAAAKSFKVNFESCYKIERGQGQSSIGTCSGLTVAPYFYVYSIFALNSLLPVSIFLLSYKLSGSLLGGLVSTLLFFYNHGEATRVMWSPPLRESFSMPFLFLQFLILTHIIRQKKLHFFHLFLYGLSTLFFMIPWQFSQFTMLTQVLCLTAVYSLNMMSSTRILSLLLTLMATLVLNATLQFGNVLLLTSYLMFCLPISMAVVACHSLYERLKWSPFIAAARMVTILVGTVVAKAVCGRALGIRDDAHIGAILLSKFTSYQDFHTQLYTCSPEFDFISLSYFGKLFLTLLLPLAAVVAGSVVWQAVFSEEVNSVSHEEQSLKAASLYHVFQCQAFAVMAVLIMRLKLFLTPQLCVLAGLVAGKKVFKLSSRHKYWLLGGLIGLASVAGFWNLNEQLNIIGEYNNPEMEKLLLWINSSTEPGAVFAGSMPLMASVKLSSGRPITNHPHYEDTGIRERTLLVYTIYSRRHPEVIHSNLKSLGADYVIVEEAWCNKAYRPGCAFEDIYLTYFPDDENNSIFCQESNVPLPFKEVYSSQGYRVLLL